MPKQAKLYTGTSGYEYPHWKGVLYPEDAPRKTWFEHYAREFATVEINNTFYTLPKPETVAHWRDHAPKGFHYALKYSQYGTHRKKLKDPATHVDPFCERAAALGDTLGPILVQLPPKWRVDVDRLGAFLDYLPSNYRWAIEFRDPSWLCDEVFELLEAHGAALCIHDLIDGHPRRVTAKWTYLRFHGEETHDYAYAHQTLAAWARWIRQHLDKGIDVYAHFNNDAEGHAVANARQLHRYTQR